MTLPASPNANPKIVNYDEVEAIKASHNFTLAGWRSPSKFKPFLQLFITE
jgi:hypothetical protein